MAKTILIVEDDQFLSDILKQQLTEAGFTALHAKDGEDGLAQFQKEKPDLIILDLILPRMNGFDFLETVREKAKTLPVIVLSNLGQDSDKEQCAKLGVKTYFVKTDVSLDQIVDAVKKAV